MELQVNEIQALQPVTFNYEELKKQVVAKAEEYKNLVYTEESISLAKTDRANLNKLSKAIADERKRIKNVLLEPFIDFEAKCKELEQIISDASENIDKQIKVYEEKEDNEKLQKILAYFISVVGEYNELLDFDLIYNERWLNKTYSMNKVQQDIDHIINKTRLDMETIDGQIQDEMLKKQVKSYYFRNINEASVLSLSLQEGKKIAETNQKITNLDNVNTEEQPTVEQTNEELQILDFRVHVTQRQKFELREFLVANKIKFEPVPKQ